MGNRCYENGVGRTSKLLHQEEAFYLPLAKVCALIIPSLITRRVKETKKIENVCKQRVQQRGIIHSTISFMKF